MRDQPSISFSCFCFCRKIQKLEKQLFNFESWSSQWLTLSHGVNFHPGSIITTQHTCTAPLTVVLLNAAHSPLGCNHRLNTWYEGIYQIIWRGFAFRYDFSCCFCHLLDEMRRSIPNLRLLFEANLWFDCISRGEVSQGTATSTHSTHSIWESLSRFCTPCMMFVINNFWLLLSLPDSS